jgi:5-methylcytosine-specific restriction protein A
MGHGGRDTFDHKKYNTPEARKRFNGMYATSQWRKLRQIQLSKHPLCAACLSEGRITQAEHLDHLFPWSALSDEAFYHNVFQSLCESCHSIKTTLEKRGVYRHYSIPCKDYALSDYAKVIKIMEKFEET